MWIIPKNHPLSSHFAPEDYLASKKSITTFRSLVTQCTLEYSQRRKSVHHTEEKGSSYLQSGRISWPTPAAQDFGGSTREDFSPKLSEVAKKWATPQSRDYRSPDKENSGNFQRKKDKGYTIDLNSMAVMWPTPRTSENDQGEKNREKMISAGSSWKGQNRGATHNRNSPCLPASVIINSLPDQDNNRMNGNFREPSGMPTAYQILYEQCGVTAGRVLRKCWEKKYGKKLTTESKLILNPHWVLQLMGTTTEKTFFAWQEMELSGKPQSSPS